MKAKAMLYTWWELLTKETWGKRAVQALIHLFCFRLWSTWSYSPKWQWGVSNHRWLIVPKMITTNFCASSCPFQKCLILEKPQKSQSAFYLNENKEDSSWETKTTQASLSWKWVLVSTVFNGIPTFHCFKRYKGNGCDLSLVFSVTAKSPSVAIAFTISKAAPCTDCLREILASRSSSPFTEWDSKLATCNPALRFKF